ncbi:MAG: haloacid dehalogenase-like hydrolase [Bifidobacterium sp.]|jgi:FMN phosphatase YigB (HAD superfamily)|nr:haloacid dehalogenase-like hydrolase [Bifidobacterium sp.]
MTLSQQPGAQPGANTQSFANPSSFSRVQDDSHGQKRSSATAASGTVVFDFDGTLCLGDGPVWSYAEHAYSYLESAVRHKAETALDEYLAGTTPMQTREAHHWQDGYDVVASFCRDRVDPRRLQEAYLASRADLASGSATVSMPAGMKDFLRELGALGCRRILLSNSPIIGLRETLARFAVTNDFDAVVPDGGKPSQWPRHLSDFTAQAESRHLLSIGDYWTNDIEPVLTAGYEVAYIHDSEPSGTHAQPTYQARELPQMYNAILHGCAEWKH